MSDFDQNLLTNTLDRLLEAGYTVADIEAKVVRWLRDNRESDVSPKEKASGPRSSSFYCDPDPKRYYKQVSFGEVWYPLP